MSNASSFVAPATALIACLVAMGLGSAIIMKRPETNSLFVEDRMGFVVAKITLGAILILLGVFEFPFVLSNLLEQCSR